MSTKCDKRQHTGRRRQGRAEGRGSNAVGFFVTLPRRLGNFDSILSSLRELLINAALAFLSLHYMQCAYLMIIERTKELHFSFNKMDQ